MSAGSSGRSLGVRVAATTFGVLVVVLGAAAFGLVHAAARGALDALDERLASEADSLAALVDHGGVELARAGAVGLERSQKDEPFYYCVVAPDGASARSAEPSGFALPPAPSAVLDASEGHPLHRTHSTDVDGPGGVPLRMSTLARWAPDAVAGAPPVVVQVARTMEEVDETRGDMWRALSRALPIALVLGTLGSFLVASRATRPILRMTREAQAVGEGRAGAGIDVGALDGELATLGATLNDAFERLRAAAAREQRFAADAAHELRTPLTTLRSRAELALSRERGGEDYRTALQDVLAASHAMQDTVDDLLLLAGTEAGSFTAERFDLREAVLRAADGAQPAASAAGRRILVEFGDRPALVHGSPALLERLVANLLENALRHGRAGPPADAVEVHVTPGDASAELVVRDRGPGFPSALLPRLFERFTRGDPSRTRETGGSGLGLSICRAIVAAHGGTIRAQGRDGGGAEVCVTLPTG